MVSVYHHISELEQHGIAKNDLARLSEAGFCTVEAVRAPPLLPAALCSPLRHARSGGTAPSSRTPCANARP
jgi:hypothetical protein